MLPRKIIRYLLICLPCPMMAAGQVAAQGTTEVAADDSAPVTDEASSVVEDPMTVIRSTLSQLWEDLLSRLPMVVAGLFILLLTWVFGRLVDRLATTFLKRTRLRTSLKDLLRQLLYTAVWVGGLLVAAIVVFPGMTPSKVLTVLGLGSIAIGFAFKDIFENFFAGVLILWRFPFDPGDYVECNGLVGKVEHISIRMTTLRQLDGQLVVVPNGILFKKPVHVLNNADTRRTTVICGVAYSEDLEKSREVIRKAVERCDSVNTNRPVEIFAQEFADSSINFEVTWWTGSSPLDIRKSRDQVVEAVKHDLDEAGIEIPFPYRTLTFKEPLEIASGDGRAPQKSG